MKQICDSQIDFIKRGLKRENRLDGRAPNEVRKFNLKVGDEVL